MFGSAIRGAKNLSYRNCFAQFSSVKSTITVHTVVQLGGWYDLERFHVSSTRDARESRI